MTLESSANVVGFNKELIVGGKTFLYAIKGKGPRIDLEELHDLSFPSL
jgi:hypothetical protein